VPGAGQAIIGPVMGEEMSFLGGNGCVTGALEAVALPAHDAHVGKLLGETRPRVVRGPQEAPTGRGSGSGQTSSSWMSLSMPRASR
jgi:hypothetical protein